MAESYQWIHRLHRRLMGRRWHVWYSDVYDISFVVLTKIGCGGVNGTPARDENPSYSNFISKGYKSDIALAGTERPNRKGKSKNKRTKKEGLMPSE